MSERSAYEDGPTTSAGSGSSGAEPTLSPLSRLLGPLVYIVARAKASVHTKLLSGFLLGALLLLGMGIMSLMVINRMSDRVSDLTTLQQKVDWSRRMEYQVTAQSHFRAMALLTGDNSNNDKIAAAKNVFLEGLNTVESMSGSDSGDFFRQVREANDRFTASSAGVLQVYLNGNVQDALKLHLDQEHPISHILEGQMRQLQAGALQNMDDARAAFDADRSLLTTLVAVFSVVSLMTALLLGLVLSSAFIRPVRRIDTVLANIAAGDFGRQILVPNRDEFGTLTGNLNKMSSQLAVMYAELRSLNENLQQKVEEQLKELERASVLKRYLSPQLAESIIGGTLDVNLAVRRRNLTIFFSDVRGFTAMSERMEPEELIDLMNQYLTAMTEVVFKYGGTLDKYIGDAIMVFFGDPVPYEDHAERAVKMGLEKRTILTELQQRWFAQKDELLTIGMGVTTGYVTVGNIGSSARMDYTVLGNHVNLASRLADHAKPGQILISERTLMAVRDWVEATEVDQVELEGVSRPIKIYEIQEKVATITRDAV